VARDEVLPLRRRRPWRVGLCAAIVLGGLILAVPPLRRSASNVTSRLTLVAMSPFAPDIGDFEDLPASTRLVAADGRRIADLGTEADHHTVRISRLPSYVPRAVLAAEDNDFYQHSGVDPTAVVRAGINDALRRPLQGGSTITQQLAKLNYTDGQRTPMRKLREALYAVQLERRYTKNELLERYLNQVYLGQNDYGLAPASEHLFGVSPEQLTPAQAATLAGRIHSPRQLDPRAHPRAAVERRDQVLRAMAAHGWLRREQLDRALAAPLELVPARAQEPAPALAPHFVELVKREAAGLDVLGTDLATRRRRMLTGGYTVTTTLDSRAFGAARAAVERNLGGPDDPTTAVVSVEPGDGAIRVLFGGLDFAGHTFDAASQGRRQPGSSFKPFVYLAMLRQGLDPRTTFDSRSPTTVTCAGTPWTVRNHEGRGGGRRTVDDAMTHSVNTVFAQLIAEVGPRAVAAAAEDAGIAPSDMGSPRCSLALGGLTRGVSPLEQAAAYATFAAKGVYAQPYSIAKITDRHGRVVYEHVSVTDHRFDAKDTGVLTAALMRVVRDGTGQAAAIGRPLAGKTGTTENNADAWFIGYVPQLATAVWVGYPEGQRPMSALHGLEVTGGSYPARIFGDYMRVALDGSPVRALYTASPNTLSLDLLTPTTGLSTGVDAHPRSPSPPPTLGARPATTVSTTTTVTPPTTTAPPSTTTTVAAGQAAAGAAG
jgi:penicillin-binding protein 1A